MHLSECSREDLDACVSQAWPGGSAGIPAEFKPRFKSRFKPKSFNTVQMGTESRSGFGAGFLHAGEVCRRTDI